MNRAIGAYLQSKVIYVIPNVRWGDERSYTTCELPEKFAFLGIEKHSIVSIGTYGCIQGKEYRRYFYEGLKAMLEELEPKVVLVYGAMPDDIFEEVKKTTEFVQYYDWISSKKSPKAVFSWPALGDLRFGVWYSLVSPRQDVTGPEVHGVMKDIIAKEVFSYNDEAGKLDGIKKAYIRDTVVTELPEA